MKNKKSNKSDITIHAVINGLVARSDSTYVTSMLGKNDILKTKSSTYKKINKRSKFVALPFVRGIAEFFEGLLLTVKGINDSTYFWEKEFEDQDEGSVLEALLMILSMVIAIALFIGGAFFVGDFLRRDRIIPLAPVRGLIEGAIRVVIILISLKIAGLFEDVKNLYKNHTAGRITLEEIEGLRKNNIDKNAKKQTIFAYLINVILICVFFFTVICIDDVWIQMICRIALIPVVAGLVYELYLFANNKDNFLALFFRSFGTILERIIYVEPEKKEINAAREAIFLCQEKDEKLARNGKEYRKDSLLREENKEEISNVGPVKKAVVDETESIGETEGLKETESLKDLEIEDLEIEDLEIDDIEIEDFDDLENNGLFAEYPEVDGISESLDMPLVSDMQEIPDMPVISDLPDNDLPDLDEKMIEMQEEIEEEIENLELQLEVEENLPKEELQLEVEEAQPAEEELQLEVEEAQPAQEELQLEVEEAQPAQEELQLEVEDSKLSKDEIQLEIEEVENIIEQPKEKLEKELSKKEIEEVEEVEEVEEIPSKVNVTDELTIEEKEKTEKSSENMVKTISGLANRHDRENGISHENYIIGVENEDLNIRDIFYKGDDLDPSEIYENHELDQDEEIGEVEEENEIENQEDLPLEAVQIFSIDDEEEDEDDEILNALDKFLE